MTARKTASLAGFAPPPAGEAAEPKILSCSTNLNYNKTRRPLQDLRGKFVVDSAHIVLIWYNTSECIIDYLKIIVP